MFLGNMQSFYRRNSLHNQTSAQSKPKEQKRKIRRVSKNETGDDEEDDHSNHNTPIRRRSFSISRNTDYDERSNEYNRFDVPVIKIGMYEPEPPKKTYNILKEKEKALWFNSCSDSDNSVRLGPNRNNIIEESLKSDQGQVKEDY